MLKQIERALNELNSRDLTKLGLLQPSISFDSVVSPSEVLEFEKNFNVQLPEDYVDFICNIGGGGFGPAYGLRKFYTEVTDDPRNPIGGSEIPLNTAFPHTESFGVINSQEEFDRFFKSEEEHESYFLTQQISGSFCICELGCGSVVLLVVNGEDSGRIWNDDRGNYGGIYPDSLQNMESLSFSEWYLAWLEELISGVPQTERRMLGA